MSVHLPECPWTPASLLHNDHLCICDRLRKAEQRVMIGTYNGCMALEDAFQRGLAQGQRDERLRIRKAVEVRLARWGGLIGDNGCRDLRAAIDGEEKP